MSDIDFMAEALAISAAALSDDGAKPFGAVVVRDGEVVGRGQNRSLANHDPTSHGETEAIRDACKNLGTLDLSGCDLFSSCEPCPMCVAVIAMAGISKLYYGIRMDDAGKILSAVPVDLRGKADMATIRGWCAVPADQRDTPSAQIEEERATDILRNWAEMKSGS